MIKELYKSQFREIKANVTSGSNDTKRKRNILKCGCRVYDGEYFGAAGTMGEPAPADWERAEQNLKLKLPYPYAPCENASRERSLGGTLDQESFINNCERLLRELQTRYPDMIFSNLINVSETEQSIQNDAGLRYISRDLFYTSSLIVKHRDSKSVFDTGIGLETRGDFVAETLDSASLTLGCFNTPARLPESKKLLLAMPLGYVTELFSGELGSEQLAKGASIFSSKLGSKAFGSGFTVCADRGEDSYGVPFFDAEGSVTAGDRIPLIQNGVLLRGFADKRCAAQYKTENTASASGTYDNMPSAGYSPLSIDDCGLTLSQMLAGRTSVWVDMMAGGDCTNEGRFASPVQTAFLMKDGIPVGRLPEFGVTFSLYDAFGEGFAGVSSDKLCGSRFAVFEAEIS